MQRIKEISPSYGCCEKSVRSYMYRMVLRAQSRAALCCPMEPTRLCCPQDFPGKNTGVSLCHLGSLIKGSAPTLEMIRKRNYYCY